MHPEGYVIGDVILFALGDDRFNLVGRPGAQLDPVPRGDRRLRRHGRPRPETHAAQDGRRKSYRFQVQGPTAMQIIEKALGGPPPEPRFFHTTTVEIAGRRAGALRHGMVGQPGCELFGPWNDREAVLEPLVTAGEELGLRRAGGRVLVQHARVRLDPLYPFRPCTPVTA